jgi:16S rRNA (adenine1518-N6/adenine1519-N6)-dimethyltransferase
MSNLSPKKSLGQHWLDDSASLEAMAESAEVSQGDTVLEIGPGLGSLTEILVNKSAEVLALEFDESLVPKLQQRFKDYNNLQIEQGDIRTFDFRALPGTYKIVANIPYYLTANLMRLLTDQRNHLPAVAALLMQKEVAERIAAEPRDMSVLAVAAQFYYETNLGRQVPARLFTPPPKVDSQVLVLHKRPKPLFPDVEPDDFFRLVKAGFSQRRKTLLNTLSSGLQLDKKVVKTVLSSVDIDPGRRAQTLSLDEWHNLYVSLHT